MTEKDFKHIFQHKYTFESWKPLYDEIFPRVEYFTQAEKLIDPSQRTIELLHRGTGYLSDNKKLAILEAKVSADIKISKNRVELRNIAANFIDQYTNHGVLIVYYSADDKQGDYRFSFITRYTEFTDQGDLVKNQTHPKRFTYVLGENESCTTATKRFMELVAKKYSFQLSLNDTIEAFSVEKLTKEFYKKYYWFFLNFCFYLLSPHSKQKVFKHNLFSTDFAPEKCIELNKQQREMVLLPENKAVRDFVKRLLGRIVFLHFLQKKAWMGCSPNRTDWTDGDKHFMQNLYLRFQDKEHFQSKCLTELFFNTLNNNRQDKNDIFEITQTRVPYLNGGLFDNDAPETNSIDFPKEYFADLFDFFEQYNFTIDENSPDEHEVGIDPEMLGHIFENLLEENKDKGAFYTPKEIVQYMCQESIVQYLKNNFPNEVGINDFIRFQKFSQELMLKENAVKLDRILDAILVCDPAIGSGAFPIGLLQEIYKAKLYIYPFTKPTKGFNPADVKKRIIENSIYGVDVDKNAVDIARLRFWLALVVDEEIPAPLPNLDYKIMQGNSLLESFEGIDLSHFAKDEDVRFGFENSQLDIFTNKPKDTQLNYQFQNSDKLNVNELIKEYFTKTDKKAKELIHQKIDNYLLLHIRYNLKLHLEINEHYIKQHQKTLKHKLSAFEKNEKQREKLETTSLEAKEINRLTSVLKTVEQKRFLYERMATQSERPYFLWHLFFKDVFDKGGFDIVIGNPPYIQLQKNGGDLAKMYENEKFETFERTGDIYALFYEKGLQILKPNGILAYITSSQWLKAGYGKSLRGHFLNQNPLLLILLGPSAFENAIVDTNILIAQKTAYKKELKGFSVYKLSDIKQISDDLLIPMPYVGTDAWAVLPPLKQKINQCFIDKGIPLNHSPWKIQINFGIKTGYNEAFILTEKDALDLIAKNSKNKEIVKPVLRGRNIEKYFTPLENDYIIGTFPALKLDIESYPDVKEQLQGYLPNILQTGEVVVNNDGVSVNTRKKTSHKWFETQDPISFFKEFSKEKLIWKRIGSDLRFSYSDEEIYCLDSTCIATGEKIKYLTALLNSKVCKYQLLESAPRTGMGDLIISVQALEPLLVHYPTETEERIIVNLLDYILYLKSDAGKKLEYSALMCAYFEQIINGCVYELYFEEILKENERNILEFLESEICSLPEKYNKRSLVCENLIVNIFKTLYNAEHPVRQRLYYMSSLDEIKTIQVKELH